MFSEKITDLEIQQTSVQIMIQSLKKKIRGISDPHFVPWA